MPFDLQRARQDTPGCDHVLHFNNAGASLMPRPVLEATIAHLQLEAQIGGYEAADHANDAIEHVYDAAAALIGCSRDEIAIIENATRAWDMAFYSIPFKPGDRILTAMAEYASNYIAFLQVTQKTGAMVEVIPNTTVVTKWKKRDDVCSDNDEQWLGECAEKTTSRGERERRALWIPPRSRKVAEFRAR